VNFTADARFRELLEEVRALVSHSEPNGDLLNVMTRALEALKEQLLKSRFGVGRKPRRAKLKSDGMRTVPERAERSASGVPRPSEVNEKQGIPASSVPACVAREVYLRDQGQCTFCAEDGRRCSERRLLQLDHVILYANGGEPSAANLRMRCRAHNLHTARLLLGDEYIRAAMARERTALERRARAHAASPAKST
jgi:5-methylcytosine-specific restriction endonuclease McrA